MKRFSSFPVFIFALSFYWLFYFFLNFSDLRALLSFAFYLFPICVNPLRDCLHRYRSLSHKIYYCDVLHSFSARFGSIIMCYL